MLCLSPIVHNLPVIVSRHGVLFMYLHGLGKLNPGLLCILIETRIG